MRTIAAAKQGGRRQASDFPSYMVLDIAGPEYAAFCANFAASNSLGPAQGRGFWEYTSFLVDQVLQGPTPKISTSTAAIKQRRGA